MKLEEKSFRSWDGAELFYRAWLPGAGRRPTKALTLFHRGHEHSGRWAGVAGALGLGDDFAVFAWDQRGHGRSPGERGFAAAGLAGIVKDAEAFGRHVCDEYGIPMRDVGVVAHSVGAVVAAAWVHDYAPPVRCLVLATPALRVRLYVPLALPALRLKRKTIGAGVVKSYVRAGMLTHDEGEAREYACDPLIFRQISVDLLLDLHDTSTRLIEDAGAITTPTLVLGAGRDWVVKQSAQEEFFRRLGSRVKQFESFDGMHHAIFHEGERGKVIECVGRFVREAFARPAEENGFLEADKGGYTRAEWDLLRTPSSPRWGMIRQSLKVGGWFSQGIRLGWETGFDSGHTLDYVYENCPRGVTPVGKVVDYFYLNSPGWRGIRVRRENLQRMLRESCQRVKADGRPVRILDIASGPGRYVAEVLKQVGEGTAVLRDYRQSNLDAARDMASQLDVTGIETVLGDAFDRTSLAATKPGPTVAVVSGLYELTPENDKVLASLSGIADAMEEGGYLVYTNQPWHPQIEFIARVLTNREGNRWVMRRRTQAEMDELVRVSGFEKIEQAIDRWGIFTVSVARRVKR